MSANLKPYPTYKDSSAQWLGDVPEHWEVLPALAAYRPRMVKNIGMIESTVLSLSYGRIIVKPSEKFHGLIPESFETYQVVDPGNIVVRTTDLQNDRTSLRVGYSDKRGIITSAYMCLETTDLVSSRYGYQFLNAYDILKIIYGYGSGLRQNLDFGEIKRMPVLVPPKAEQFAIVRFLNHLDLRIRQYILTKQKLINLLEEQKRVVIHRAVTRGLDPGVEFKWLGVSWLGEIPKSWGVWQIGHFSRVGNGSTPSRSNAAYWTDGEYPWLNSSHANRTSVTSSDQFVTETALRECHLPHVQPGSVLVAITGQGKTRGKATVLEIESTINQHLAYITPRRSLALGEYLQRALTAAYQQLRAISDDSGSTKGALTCGDLKQFKVALPSLPEQRAIVAEIDASTRSIEVAAACARREIDLIREYRSRLVADVVTGKLDVREAAANLPDEVGEPDDLSPLTDEMLEDVNESELASGGLAEEEAVG